MTVHLVISLQKTPYTALYIHMVLANPKHYTSSVKRYPVRRMATGLHGRAAFSGFDLHYSIIHLSELHIANQVLS